MPSRSPCGPFEMVTVGGVGVGEGSWFMLEAQRSEEFVVAFGR